MESHTINADEIVPFPESFSETDLAELLDGGQAFRWNRQPDGSWIGQWDRNICRISRNSAGEFVASGLPESTPAFRKDLKSYFGLDQNWAELRNSLPWRSDSHLANCIESFPRLRILRQPFAETLLSFLCSATKQIPQIKQMCEKLARNLGTEISPGFFALPTWAQIAESSEEELRKCALGFRARHIHATARIIAQNPNILNEIEQLPYPKARKELMHFPGVGEKVADCVLLFGAGKLEAFPVDVWILRVMENRYRLNGWKNSQIAHFGRIHFGPLAGFAQQFLFSFERRNR